MEFKDNIDWIKTRFHNPKTIFKQAQEIGDPKAKLFLLMAIGDNYITKQKYNDALHVYERALKIADNLEKPRVAVSILAEMAKIYLLMGKDIDAMRFSYQALNLSQKHGYRPEDYKIYLLIAEIYLYRKDYPNVIGKYEEILGIAKERGDLLSESIITEKLLGFYTIRGDSSEQIQDRREKLAGLKLTIQSMEDLQQEIKIVQDELEQINIQSALEKINVILQKAEGIGDSRMIADVLFHKSIITQLKGDYTTTLKLMNDALKSYEKIGGIATISFIYANMGTVFLLLDDSKEAERNANVAFEICDQLCLKPDGQTSTLCSKIFNQTMSMFIGRSYP